MARNRTKTRIRTTKRGRSANPVLASWVSDNADIIVANDGCDFDSADIGVFARSGLADPIGSVCRIIRENTGLYLSGDSSSPDKDPAGWTMPDGRVFYGLSPVNRHKDPLDALTDATGIEADALAMVRDSEISADDIEAAFSDSDEN